MLLRLGRLVGKTFFLLLSELSLFFQSRVIVIVVAVVEVKWVVVPVECETGEMRGWGTATMVWRSTPAHTSAARGLEMNARTHARTHRGWRRG
jgi:hypothetical protein